MTFVDGNKTAVAYKINTVRIVLVAMFAICWKTKVWCMLVNSRDLCGRCVRGDIFLEGKAYKKWSKIWHNSGIPYASNSFRVRIRI